MRLSVHLTFTGQCREAFAFYEQCFQARILTLMTYGESPMAMRMPAEHHDKVLHVSLQVGDDTLMGADLPPGRESRSGGFYVVARAATVADAERIFAALSAGGTVEMPLQKTFWSQAFGMVVDRFGTPWEINCEAYQ